MLTHTTARICTRKHACMHASARLTHAHAHAWQVFSELLGHGYRLIGCTAPVLTAGATFDHRVWHRDFRAHEQLLRERYGEFFMATAVLYTQDESFRNGAIQVIPRSHQWPLDQSYITEEEKYATEGVALSADAPAGSILFFVGSTFHRSGTLACASTSVFPFRLPCAQQAGLRSQSGALARSSGQIWCHMKCDGLAYIHLPKLRA